MRGRAHGLPYAALGGGVLAVSTAAIFIRLAQADGAPSLALAAGRLWVAALVLTPLVARSHRAELRAVRGRTLGWALLAGLALGLHFAAWITSLEYTAVVNSVTLVTSTPLWVALVAPFALGERPSRAAVWGLALALSGGVLVGLSGAVGEPPTRHAPALGNGLAIFGAWMAALYFLIGRKVRARVGVVVYAWLVYGVAALVLSGALIAWRVPVRGFPARVYLWVLLMGLIPQLLGHSAFNYALGYLPAAYVSLVILGEPVGSGILAILILDEWPVALQLLGATLILAGIAVASLEAQSPAPQDVAVSEV